MKCLLIKILKYSLDDIYQYDAVNINDDVSEWNICARLAMYIEKRMRFYDFFNRTEIFKNYYVDVEYNRSYNAKPKIVDGKHVRCDLLIHSRESTKPNYLVLELKKSYNNDIEDDINEIKRMVSPREEGAADFYNCGTLLGVFLEFKQSSYNGTIYSWENDRIKEEML